MNVVFCGTPAFAVPTLERLVEAGIRVDLVVTQPDRPRGRGMEVEFSPVKSKAIELGLQIVQPEKIKNNNEFRDQLVGINADVIVVVGYGRIIPPWLVDLPRLGNINLHASLLPKYRGAAPIQWAIANGETTTGVTTMRIDTGLDTGDILLQKEVQIDPNDTAVTLAPKLAAIGSDLMVQTLNELQIGTLRSSPQNHSMASLAPILKKEDGRIDFQRTAESICNRMRGFQPWPGAFTTFRKKNLNISRGNPVHRALRKASELFVEDKTLIVGCGQGTALSILELQPEGKKRMPVAEFIRGYHPHTGELLG